MILTGAQVRFWLSPAGMETLKQVIPKSADFEALVFEEDGIGLWIYLMDEGQEADQATLLKWEYVASARLEYRPDAPQERSPAGFRRPSKC